MILSIARAKRLRHCVQCRREIKPGQKCVETHGFVDFTRSICVRCIRNLARKLMS